MDASETRLQKATKETNVAIRSRNSSLSSLSSVCFSPSASPTSEASNFYRRQQSNRIGVGFATFRYLRFLLFTFSLLAALLRIGWVIKTRVSRIVSSSLAPWLAGLRGRVSRFRRDWPTNARADCNQVFHVFDALLKSAHLGCERLQRWLLRTSNTTHMRFLAILHSINADQIFFQSEKHSQRSHAQPILVRFRSEFLHVTGEID